MREREISDLCGSRAMPKAPSLLASQGAPMNVIAPSTWSSDGQSAPGSVNVIARQGGGEGGEGGEWGREGGAQSAKTGRK